MTSLKNVIKIKHNVEIRLKIQSSAIQLCYISGLLKSIHTWHLQMKFHNIVDGMHLYNIQQMFEDKNIPGVESPRLFNPPKESLLSRGSDPGGIVSMSSLPAKRNVRMLERQFGSSFVGKISNARYT